jgi:hypothetical protein
MTLRFSLLVRMLTAGSSAVAFPAGVAAFHFIKLLDSFVEILTKRLFFRF